MLEDSKQKLHFLHIGKTGGSSIKHALSNDLRQANYDIKIHRHSTHLEDIPIGDKVFFFLRDPADRFVSAFNSRKRQGRPKTFQPWSINETTAFNLFETADDLARALSSNDNDAAKEAMQHIFHVKNHLWEWFINEEYLRTRLDDILFVGNLASITEDFEDLKQLLGLDMSCALPTDPVASHKTPGNMCQTLSNKGRENIKQWYKNDYRLLEFFEAFFTTQVNSIQESH